MIHIVKTDSKDTFRVAVKRTIYNICVRDKTCNVLKLFLFTPLGLKKHFLCFFLFSHFFLTALVTESKVAEEKSENSGNKINYEENKVC